MQIPLAQMTKGAGARRKSVFLRQVVATQSIELDLYSIYRDGLLVWAGLANAIASSYQQPAKSITTDAGPDGQQIQFLVDQAARQAENTILYQTEKTGKWVSKVGKWHGEKTISSVKSATGVDVNPYINLNDVRPMLQDSIRANVSLMKNLNAATQSKIEQIVYDGLANRRTKKYVTDALSEAMSITKKRARLIAGDQSNKLNIALTSYRNQQLGIEMYKWIHIPQKHPRYNHVARHGKLFRWDTPPDDGPPGYQPNCKCQAQPMVDMENDDQGG